MAEVRILKAVEFDKLSSATKKKFKSAQGLRDAGWWVQRKYDGCFGMAVIRPGGQSQMLSRAGEDYTVSCQHILQALERCALEQSPSPDPFVVIGEVWKLGMQFKDISGRFRQQREAATELVFACHDLLPEDLETHQAYARRFENLEDLLAYSEVRDPLFATDTDRFHRTPGPGVEEQARALVAMGGYDGLILKDPNAPYTIGLAKEGQIVKVKPTFSLDLRVTDVFVEKGERTGRDVFSIEVEYKGVRSRVGSGMPHEASGVPGRGQIVEVEAMGLTPDGKLREPRFKGIRYDKEQPDG